MSEDTYEMIVVDAANIVHTNMEGDEGQTLCLFPERLERLVELCESMGWNVKCFMKHGTYHWASKNTEKPTVGDVRIFDRMIRSGHLTLLKTEHDDIWWIDYAMEQSALILTKDRFRGERQAFQDRDWTAIDRATLRSFEFTAEHEPLVPDLKDRTNEGRMSWRGLKERVTYLEENMESLLQAVRRAGIEIDEVTVDPERMVPKGVDEVDVVTSITHAVYEQAFRDGGTMHMTPLLYQLVRAHLDVGTRQQEWPKDWLDQLRERLGVSGKPGEWLEGLSPRPTERVGDHKDHLRFRQHIGEEMEAEDDIDRLFS